MLSRRIHNRLQRGKRRKTSDPSLITDDPENMLETDNQESDDGSSEVKENEVIPEISNRSICPDQHLFLFLPFSRFPLRLYFGLCIR